MFVTSGTVPATENSILTQRQHLGAEPSAGVRHRRKFARDAPNSSRGISHVWHYKATGRKYITFISRLGASPG